jgi:hypothetical protein
MKKLITAIVLIFTVVVGLMPCVEIPLKIAGSRLWLWLVILSGFLGLYTINFKMNVYVKAIAIFGFISLFFSQTPFFSQYAYMELLACIYFYYLCTLVEDWSGIFRTLNIMFLVSLVFMVMQYFHKDNILNYGSPVGGYCGTVGNPMQNKSFILILLALIIQNLKWLKPYIKMIWVVVIMAAIAYFFDHHCMANLFVYRGPVWLETIRLSGHKLNSTSGILFGYGLGSYKMLFHVIGQISYLVSIEGIWYNAHNFFVQALFEMGVIGCLLVTAYVITLFLKCKGILLVGALIIIYTLMFHFPDRVPSTVPLLILFAAYIERKVYG